MRVGVLTGGGDCPGLNAVIRGIVRRGIDTHGFSLVGFRYGWGGGLGRGGAGGSGGGGGGGGGAGGGSERGRRQGGPGRAGGRSWARPARTHTPSPTASS